MDPAPKNNLLLSGAVVAVLVLMVAGVAAYSGRDTGMLTDAESSELTDAEVPTATPAATPLATATSGAVTPTPAATVAASTYKDGTYTSTGTYSTPGGSEEIRVTLTIANGVVTASTVSASGNERESREYQAAFIGGYKQVVIGKDIDSISLSRVSGSSLTPKGFNSALASIKSQAKS